MPTYQYVCKECGAEVELTRSLVEDARHMVGKPARVCGTLRRVWSANFNKVPGGGRA